MSNNGYVSIIADQDILRERHIPNKLIDRQEQIGKILSYLTPAITKRIPAYIWLYGTSGTGKTAAANYVLNHLQEKLGISGMAINCWKKRSFYEILDEIISELKILGADEHRTSFKLEKLSRHLKDRPFVVVLDEIDRMKNKERPMALYNLNLLMNVTIVCISTSQKTLFGLEQRVRSRLHFHVFHFHEYSDDSLLQILRCRAGAAFTEGSWSDSSLKLIASIANGDARVAIRSLRKAALSAEHNRSSKICTKNLADEAKAVLETRKASILDSLTEDHRMLFNTIRQNNQILSGDLRESYLQQCEQIGRRPLALRTFSEYCTALINTDLVTSERARVKGKVRLFKPAVLNGY